MQSNLTIETTTFVTLTQDQIRIIMLDRLHPYLNILLMHFYAEREGTLESLLQESSKFYNNIFLFFGNNFGDFLILIGWFFKLSVQTFQPLVVIYICVSFVYHRWGCT